VFANHADAMKVALASHQAGDLAGAEAIYRQIISEDPCHADAIHMLGVIAGQVGRTDAAIDLISRALAIHSENAEANNNLGSFLQDRGRLEDAIIYCRRATELDPAYADAHYNLGNALAGLGRFDAAITAFRQAISIRAHFPLALNNLGGALLSLARLDDAIAAYRQAIELEPAYADAHNNLGSALAEKGKIDEAITAYEKAIAINPNCAPAHNNLANALVGKGQLEKARGCYRKAIDLARNDSATHSNLIYTLYFCPDVSEAEILAETRQWARQHADRLRPLICPHDNNRNPDRPLRIGYFSPDFRATHCQYLFTDPLFQSHNRDQFEIYCYANVARPDSGTERLRSLAKVWRSTIGLSDEQIAVVVRNDRIDILVDLTMHMSYGRPRLFAQRPAPIQVAWLAYPGTTGLETIDYRLTDPHLDPPGTRDELYSEKSIRLPHTFWCYNPHSDEPVHDLPALREGRITFGCLNNFCKVNDEVLAIWSRVLADTPDSRLILLSPAGDHRRSVIEKLAIDPSRIELVEHQPRDRYLQIYHRIDIALDTIPYNGHTTTLDALWMGVPVVTLVGETIVGRAGLSILSNLNLPELIAHDADEFVQIATSLASNITRVSELRKNLRDRMARSPLMDGDRFARAIEEAYRAMWRQWILH
jgi:predicted O-linked N-acetylglucosamine transferase (SPINDLY family)